MMFAFGLRGLGLLKAKGKEGIQYFGLCCVVCHQVSGPIQQQAHNFPDMSSAADVFPGVLLVALHHYHEFRLVLPNCVPKPSDSASLHFLGHLSQLFPLAHFSFVFWIFWEFLVHPCRAPATLA